MKSCLSWVVLACLLWSTQMSPVKAGSMIEIEVPTYEAMLAREAPLSPDARALQQLIQGTIVPTPAWVQAHPDLKTRLFDELLSDAVLARAAQEPGLVADPEILLARLAAGDTGRVGQLYARYRLWLAGNYDWQTESEHRLERELAGLIGRIASDWRVTIEQLPRMDEPNVIRAYTSVTLSDVDPEPFSPPELMQRWQELLQMRNRPENALPELFASLRFARELPYPALEIRLLDLLEDVLTEYGQGEQGFAAVRRAQLLAQAPGFEGLATEIDLELSLYEEDLLPALKTFQARIAELKDSETRQRLSLRLAIYLLRRREFETAGQVLQPLTQELSARSAGHALELAMTMGYPFAWERVLDGLASRLPAERRAALSALSHMTEPDTGHNNQKSELPAELDPEVRQQLQQRADAQQKKVAARREFYRGLGPALALSLHDSDPEIQQLTLVAYTALAKFKGVLQPELAELMALLKTDHPGLQLAAFQALYAREKSLSPVIKRQLLPLLKTLDKTNAYYLLELIQDLKGPDVIQTLDSFLQPQTPAWLWKVAWQQLQGLEPVRARQRLETACLQSGPEADSNCLSGLLGFDAPEMPESLVRLLTTRTFGRDDFYSEGASLPVANLPRLLGLLHHTDTQVLHGVLASLHSLQVFAGDKLSVQRGVELQTALLPLLAHQNAQVRLQASELYLMFHNEKSRVLLNKLLAGEQPADFLLALTSLQSWASAQGVTVPDVPLERLAWWLGQPDQVLVEPLAWTQVRGTGQVSGKPLSLYIGLAQLLQESWVNSPQLPEAKLLDLLKHPSPEIRVFAIERLGWKQGPQIFGALQNLLGDGNPQVRLAAYGSLLKIRKGLYSYYLEELQVPAKLPEDTDQRIRFILRDSEAGKKLMFSQEYAHLRTRPAYREALWERLSEESDTDQMFLFVSQLSQGAERPKLERIMHLLEARQASLTRAAGLRMLLNQVPPLSVHDPVFERLQADTDVVLQLGTLLHWFNQQDYPRARSLMQSLVRRTELKPDRGRLSMVWAMFPDELPEAVTVEGLVQSLIVEYGPAYDPDESSLPDWLNWIADRNLPLSWRQAVLGQVAHNGNSPDLLPLLDVLRQDPALSKAADSAHEAIRKRLAKP